MTEAPGYQAAPAKGPNFSDLRTRVISGVVMVAAAVGALVAGGAPFILFWLAAAIAMVWEWQRLLGEERRLARVVVGAAALAVACAFAAQNGADYALAILGLGALAVGWLGRARPAGLGRRRRPLCRRAHRLHRRHPPAAARAAGAAL
ncbi:MAG: phosphatidate cytidylyltransferase [Rhodoblastus sp.]